MKSVKGFVVFVHNTFAKEGRHAPYRYQTGIGKSRPAGMSVGFGGWQQAGAQGVTDEMLAAEAGVSWLHVNGNWAGHRYSTLNQVNASNAGDLRVAWIYSTGGETDAQCTPI